MAAKRGRFTELHIQQTKLIINILLLFLFFSCNNEKNAKTITLPAEVNIPVIDSNKSQKPILDSNIDIAYNKARADLFSNHAKYYAYGEIGPSKKFIDSFKMKYNVEVISVGCIVDHDMIYYNKIIDSFIKS